MVTVDRFTHKEEAIVTFVYEPTFNYVVKLDTGQDVVVQEIALEKQNGL